jgi:hypothetical protein
MFERPSPIAFSTRWFKTISTGDALRTMNRREGRETGISERRIT